MTRPNAFLGLPLKFHNICMIYPPSVNDILNIPFDIYTNLLIVDQNELNDELDGQTDNDGNQVYIPTPLEYLMIQIYNSEDIERYAHDAFKFFLHEEVNFLVEAKSILVGDLETEIVNVENFEDLKIINEDNYLEFQNLIRESLGYEPAEKPEIINDEDPRIRAIKAKARYRDKIKAKQNQKLAPTLETSLASICCMGIGLTPLNIGEVSYASISKLIETNQKREKYDLDCRSLLMGADADKIDMQYWIRNSE